MKWFLSLAAGLVLGLLGSVKAAYSLPPEYLFEQKWAEVCADQNGVEAAEYVVFSDGQWCDYFVDTFRVQSNCTDATFTPMEANRIRMDVQGQGAYIIEFLWASQISIMEIVSQKPFKLQQVQVLGRAEERENLKTNYLYCP